MLHLLEQVRHYCEACWSWQENHERSVEQDDNPSESGHKPTQQVTLSFCFPQIVSLRQVLPDYELLNFWITRPQPLFIETQVEAIKKDG